MNFSAAQRLKRKLDIYQTGLQNHKANMNSILIGLDFLESQLEGACVNTGETPNILATMRAIVDGTSTQQIFEDIFKEIEALKDE